MFKCTYNFVLNEGDDHQGLRVYFEAFVMRGTASFSRHWELEEIRLIIAES